MSLAIGISFLSGRFHATPWGRHVNEGEPEWPPSPWRLLRAMAATWKRKLYMDVRVNDILPLVLGKLVTPPVFFLPPATAAHTRHFMPWHKKWTPDYPHKAKTEVFDAFVVLERTATVIVYWPDVVLSESERSVTDLILDRVNYFGRAESWVHMRRTNIPQSYRINCVYEGFPDALTTNRVDPIEVIAPHPETWHVWDYSREALKPDPAWNLLAETVDLQRERWSHPPGSRNLTYLRSTDALEAKPRFRVRKHEIMNTARFVLDGQVLPLLTETLYVGELARQFLQGTYGRLFEKEQSSIFSGKDSRGEPLTGHRHAFFLPTDEDGDGRLDRITIHCAEGFGDRELRALDAWRRMRRPGGGTDLNLMLVGLMGRNDEAITDSIPLLSHATIWQSITPFVAPRHLKKRGTKQDKCRPEEFPEIVLREEIERRGLPSPVRVSTLKRCHLWNHEKRTLALSRRNLSWLQFRRDRLLGGGKRGLHPGCGFQIEFPELVSGPISLGYGCHFGLGLFAPMQK